ncbi:MAG: hypothetical protein ACTSPK_02545 [Candidatus Heimdallarchaeota archaeon]
MGAENLAKKIDLVVMTGSVPFMTAGIYQEDQSDATLISGALSGMSNMFQEMLQEGELRYSELYNAHVYIRHLSQLNDTNNIIRSDIKQRAQMRVAIIVREGELTREHELALSEFCYSIMVKICERPKIAKKLVKGNIEGYLPTIKETREILAGAIDDYRKRARKSQFYESPNFLQEKDKFVPLPTNNAVLEEKIQEFADWLIYDYYPKYFPEFAFKNFFGKENYWRGIKQLEKEFAKKQKTALFKENLSSDLFLYIQSAGLMPILLYNDNIIERISKFYANEFPKIIKQFISNILLYRGPIGISHRTIKEILSELEMKDQSKIGWNFLKFYLEEISARPFEKPYLKQICKILEQFNIHQKFASTIYNTTKSLVVPKSYLVNYTAILNDNFSKPLSDFTLICEPEEPPKTKTKTNADNVPGIPSTKKITPQKQDEIIEIPKELVECDTELPKHTPESNRLKDDFLARAITKTYYWIHEFIYGKFYLSKKSLPISSDDGLFFYNIAESLAIEIGIFHELVQAYTSPRNSLIAQLERTIEKVTKKLKQFETNTKKKYPLEKKMSFDVKYIPDQFKRKIERIVNILTQVENDALKGKITKENLKSYLETGFLGRVQEFSIPQAKKVLDELKSNNRTITSKELDKISKATAVDFKELTTNIVFLPQVSTVLPGKDSEYSKTFREIITQFKKFNIDLPAAFDIIFRMSLEMPDFSQLKIHKKLLNNYLRNTLPENVNNILDNLPNSQTEKAILVRNCFHFREELFQIIGMKILSLKPLNLILTIPLTKMEEGEGFLFKFKPLELPKSITEKLLGNFVLKENGEETDIVIGKEYHYQPYNNETPSNLTELLISDAYRKTMETIQEQVKIIAKMGKKIHSGIPNLNNQLLESYHYIIAKLTL